MNVSFEQMKDNHKVLLFLLLVGIGSWLFYCYLYIPQTEKLAQLQAQYAGERQRVERIEAFLKEHGDPESYLLELDGKKANLDKMLPDNQEIREFFVLVEKAATDSKVKLNQIKFAQATDKKGYREVPVEIQINGSYFQILDFVNKLETATRFNAVAKILLKQGKELQADKQSENEKNGIESNITTNIYVYDPKAAGK